MKFFRDEDRRRNTFGLDVSDAEQELIYAEMTARNMSKTDFMRAAIESYTGKKIFRETMMCGGRLRMLNKNLNAEGQK